MTDTELFNDDSGINEEPSKYADWDADQLRKKAIAADNHIKTLEEEARHYRENNQTENTLKEVLAKLDKVHNTPNDYMPNGDNHSSLQPSSGDQVTKDDILNLVNTSIEQKQKESLAKANVAKVETELKKIWGESYQQKLKDRAKELGVNQTFLGSMAENYPDAFLNLIRPASTGSPNPNVHVPPSGVGNTQMKSDFQGENYRSFKQMEKDNPNLRHDPAFQRRKLQAAERLGDAFYN